ncbi:MAG: hypothetical protein WCO51_12190, partial [bacterium]
SVSVSVCFSQLGARPGEVRGFEQDPEVIAQREAEFKRYLKQKGNYNETDTQQSSGSSDYSSSNHANDLNRDSYDDGPSPLTIGLMRIFDRLLILLSLIIAVGVLNRSAIECSVRPIVDARSLLRKITIWPARFDPLFIIGSICLSSLAFWYMPYAGENALLFYFSVVLPLSAFAVSWHLLETIARSIPTLDIYKRLALSIAAVLLAAQYSFEPWPMVTVKVFIWMPLIVCLIRSSALLAYRAFLIPVVFSLIFSVTRLLGSDTISFLVVRFILNICIIYLTFRSFLKAREKSEANWDNILDAGRFMIGMRSSFNAPIPPPPPPTRWFLFVDGKVTGPVVEPELRSGLSTARWATDILVCREGDTEWKNLIEVISAPTPTPSTPCSTPISEATQHSMSESVSGSMGRKERRASERQKLIYVSTFLILLILAILLGALI